MTHQLLKGSIAVQALLLAALIAGCSGSRNTSVSGYSESQLAGKRVFAIVPMSADVALSDQEAYATARGTTTESVREQVATDLRTYFVPELDALLDSNVVLSYIDAPANGLHPINASRDFTASGPASWDLIQKAAKEANADYMIVVNGMSVRTERGTGRGSESVECYYQLLDPEQRKVMASGKVEVDAGTISAPSDVYFKLADKIATKLPFVVGKERTK